jgi:hypothetical protein
MTRPAITAMYLGLLAMSPATAAKRPIVLELFTSQSCSSCPPADALLAELAQRQADLLALDFHVDYWNRLNWRDPFASADATLRQRAYAAALGTEVFTPELVVDGVTGVVGSERGRVDQAIAVARAARARAPEIALSAHLEYGRAAIYVGPGTGWGRVLIVGYDPKHVTDVGAGENAGRTLTEIDVVRAWRDIGAWQGAALRVLADLPRGEQAAVLLQDERGKVLAATRITP